MSDEITRRRVLRASAATATGICAIGGIGTATRSSLETGSTGTRADAGDGRTDIRDGPANPSTGDIDAERIPPVDLRDEAVQLRPVGQYGVKKESIRRLARNYGLRSSVRRSLLNEEPWHIG